MYILGYAAGSASIPMFMAWVSAVLMLDSDAPNALGVYVTRVSMGIILLFIQFLEGGRSVSTASSRHSVATAVMIGYWFVLSDGVSPPSTATKSGDGDRIIRVVTCASSGRIRGLLNGSRLRVPVV